MWIIEVQHASDHNLDGKWYELERCEDEDHADRLVRYFGTESPMPKGIRPEECHITGGVCGKASA